MNCEKKINNPSFGEKFRKLKNLSRIAVLMTLITLFNPVLGQSEEVMKKPQNENKRAFRIKFEEIRNIASKKFFAKLIKKINLKIILINLPKTASLKWVFQP
jgi:hypothetical protein